MSDSTNTKSLIEKYKQKSGTNNLSFVRNKSVRKMLSTLLKKDVFNLEEFERRILQIEVRLVWPKNIQWIA